MSVVLSLKNLVKRGRTIVASIHQPRSQIVSLFDNLILVSEGKTIYNGEMKSSA
jgi:ABC-type multidrug transport system ATPase subunit